MSEESILIEYQRFASIEELSIEDRELLKKAMEATNGSYAPYSHFRVGAALRFKNGKILSAANQENGSFPSGQCAERSLLFYAHANFPEELIDTIAIAAYNRDIPVNAPVYPCGACRQVMIESEMRSGGNGANGGKIRVITGGEKGVEVFPSVRALLPFGFELSAENYK